MQYYRCKCGNATSWTSMGVPRCVACSKCGSDLAPGPDQHSDPEPHEYMTRFDPNTGAPFQVCRWCLRRQGEEG